MTQPPNEPPGGYPQYPDEPQHPGYGRPHPQPGPHPGAGGPAPRPSGQPSGQPYGQPYEQQYDQPFGGQQYGQPYGQQYGQPYGQQYEQQAYSAQQYEPGGYGGPPPQAARAGLGARARQRPWPRTGPAIGAAGAALLLVGTLIWSAGYLVEGLFGGAFDDDSSEPSTSRRFLGFALFLILAIAGYVVLIARRRGVLATAGTVLAAGAVPLALTFVTFDLNGGFNTDVIYLVSIVVWLVSYLVVPGARGRATFLTAALVSIPSYISIKIIGNVIGTGFSSFGFGSLDGRDGGGTATDSDFTTVGAVVLVFGVAYYVLAALLDRRQRAGAAVAFVIAGFGETAVGLAVLTRDVHAIGLGVLLIVLGLAFAAYGGWAGRRFTTWVWAAAVAGGVVAILAGAIDDSFTGAGVAAMIIGVVVVAGSAALSRARREAPDIEEPAPAAVVPPG